MSNTLGSYMLYPVEEEVTDRLMHRRQYGYSMEEQINPTYDKVGDLF